MAEGVQVFGCSGMPLLSESVGDVVVVGTRRTEGRDGGWNRMRMGLRDG